MVSRYVTEHGADEIYAALTIDEIRILEAYINEIMKCAGIEPWWQKNATLRDILPYLRMR